MTYDRDTGDVTIHESAKQKKKKSVITSFDDVEKMKRELYEENDFDE